MNFEKEFEGNIKQLMQLLKKMMAQYPNLDKEEIIKFLKNPKNSPDVNIFFLNLAPLSSEEFDDLEEIFEESLFADGGRFRGELKYEISRDDEEFLRKNGIRF